VEFGCSQTHTKKNQTGQKLETLQKYPGSSKNMNQLIVNKTVSTTLSRSVPQS